MIYLDSQSVPYVRATFQALTDAILPSVHSYGDHKLGDASDQGVHEYIIDALDHQISVQYPMHHQVIPLAYPTAVMLDVAAWQLAALDQTHVPTVLFPAGGMFTRLSRPDRIRALSLLENLDVDLYLLPSPYHNNAGLIQYVVDALNRFAMFGYYSEWPAYGTSRLFPPDFRRLEHFPIQWHQIGYPGVSLGYRDFRGFLFTMAQVRGEQ